MAKEMKFDEGMAVEYAKGVRRTLPTYDVMFKMVHSYLRQNIGNQGSILIVGAGGGTELEVFGSEKGWTFTAVDPSASMLAVAASKATDLGIQDRSTFITGTVESVDNRIQFDAATNLLVLHFIADMDDKRSTLRTINRLLKPGSPFVIASMFGEPGWEEFEGKIKLWKQYWLDRTKLSPEDIDEMEASIRTLSFLPEEDIRSLLVEAGFERVTKFLETAMFGGWICYKSESGER